MSTTRQQVENPEAKNDESQIASASLGKSHVCESVQKGRDLKYSDDLIRFLSRSGACDEIIPNIKISKHEHNDGKQCNQVTTISYRQKIDYAFALFGKVLGQYLEHDKILFHTLSPSEAEVARLFDNRYLLWALLYPIANWNIALAGNNELLQETHDIESIERINKDVRELKNATKYFTKKVKKLLVSGHNPNSYPNWFYFIYGNALQQGKFDAKDYQRSSQSILTEHYQIATEYPSIMWEGLFGIFNPDFYISAGTNFLMLPTETQEMLLNYGFLPIERDRDGSIHSMAREIADHYMDSSRYPFLKDSARLVGNVFTKPQKQLTSCTEEYRIVNITYSNSNNTIITQIEFSNKRNLSTIIKPVEQLTVEEKNTLAIQFNTVFEDAKDSKKDITPIFNDDLAENKKYKIIEVLYNNKRIIGFNLFEVLQFTLDKKYIVVHVLYSLLKPEFRGARIMPYLILRPSFAIQQLYPECRVGTFFNSIHIFSYLLIHNFTHFPKHQNPRLIAVVAQILEMIYKSDCTLKSDGTMTCFIEEKDPIKVRGERYPKKQDDKLHHAQSFFYREILAGKDRVGAPIYTEVNEESLQQLCVFCSQLGMLFPEDNARFSASINVMLAQLLAQETQSLIPNAAAANLIKKAARL